LQGFFFAGTANFCAVYRRLMRVRVYGKIFVKIACQRALLFVFYGVPVRCAYYRVAWAATHVFL
jgi:hypothetical protein